MWTIKKGIARQDADLIEEVTALECTILGLRKKEKIYSKCVPVN